jgi:pyruvate/2-oxoglutarate dehydrogenase complex dihydrolipoamide dehydrogenase (E3) component
VICTGTRPAIPDIPGLAAAGFLTNESVFNLSALPPRLAVIGGGPIGCELAQAFQRLGAQVTLVHNKSHLLDREDDDAAKLLAQVFAREGIRIISPAKIIRVSHSSEGKTLHYESNGGTASVVVNEILVAAGRTPNIESLNLQAAGVAYDTRQGVKVDDHLRTANRRIFAAGDICLHWKFTHAADFTARIAVQNALFLGRKKLSALNMSWCTYTDPEIAHVGLSEREAEKRGLPCQSFLQPLSGVDRATTDGATEGYVKILVRHGTDKICGATIMAPRAGDLIAEIAVAMKARLGLGALANVIHPYPTLAEAIRKCGDAWNRTRLTPSVKNWLARWLAWRR